MEPAWAWRVLGLAPGDSLVAVRRAFRAGAQLVHPDRVTDLPPEVRAEAHRRMVELAEAHRVCAALAVGAPPPPPRAHFDPGAAAASGPLRSVGGQAAALLEAARRDLLGVAPWDAYQRQHPTPLDREDNAAASSALVTRLEQVADAWPGTAEGDEARQLLVTSVAARNALSARERAGHLVLVVNVAARDAAWDALHGRDELGVAQVVYAHPTASDALRHRARQRLAELSDWSTLANDPDDDVRRNACAHVLLRESLALTEQAPWLSRRDRVTFDERFAAWRSRAAALAAEQLADSLQDALTAAERSIGAALDPLRSRARG